MRRRRWFVPVVVVLAASGCSSDGERAMQTTVERPPSTAVATTSTAAATSTAVATTSTATTTTNATTSTAPATSTAVATATNAATSTSAAEQGALLPDTPAGRQLRWLLDRAATSSDEELAAHVSSNFLPIPPSQVRKKFARAIVVKEVLDSTETRLRVRAAAGDEGLLITVNVDGREPQLVTDLQLTVTDPPAAPTNWTGVDELFDTGAATHAYVVEELAADGTLHTLHRHGDPARPVPIDALVDLYVAGAVVRAVEDGRLRWDDELTPIEHDKSMAAGELRERPEGSTVTVREATVLLFRRDITASDLLRRTVGREQVEAMLEPMGMGAASRRATLPVLTWRELYTLKYSDPRPRVRYVAADEAGRRAVLEQITNKRVPQTVSSDAAFTPAFVDEIGWFATPAEVAAAHAWLEAHLRSVAGGTAVLDEARRLSPLPWPDRTVWPWSWSYSGGEPGVRIDSRMLERADGRRFVVVVSAFDPVDVIDEDRVTVGEDGILALLGKAG